MSGELRAALAFLSVLVALIVGAPFAFARRPHYGISHAQPVTFDELQNLGVRNYRAACLAHNAEYSRLICTFPGQMDPCYNFSIRLPQTQLFDPTRINVTRVSTLICESNLRPPISRSVLCCHSTFCLHECYQLPLVRGVDHKLNWTRIRADQAAARKYWRMRAAELGV